MQIAPTGVTLDGSQTADLTMSSLDARDLIFDVEAVTWDQNGDADTFAPAPELLVAPPVFDVQPYERELVRIAFRAPPPQRRSEQAYRLRFREVREAGAAGNARILEVPVFVAPAEKRGRVLYELHEIALQKALLTVRNDSNEHVHLTNVHIELAGEQAYSGSLNAYVLAGNTRSFALALSRRLQGAAEARLMVSGDGSETTVNVPIR